VRALYSAENSFKSIILEDVTPLAFIVRDGVTSNLVNCTVKTFSSVEKLQLDLATNKRRQQMPIYPLRGLQILLDSMPQLRSLVLSLPYNSLGAWERFTQDQIFHHQDQWTNLRILQLRGLQKDIVQPITLRLPNLEHIAFQNIRLHGGRWQCVAEYLSTRMRLSSFPL